MRPKRRTLKKQYNDCLRDISEMQEYIQELQENHENNITELDYLHSFIEYKGLSAEYHFFHEHAYKKYSDDDPFPPFTL